MLELTIYATTAQYSATGYSLNIETQKDYERYYANDDEVQALGAITVPEPDVRWLVREGLKKAEAMRQSAQDRLQEDLNRAAEFESKFLCLAAPVVDGDVVGE